MLSAFHLVGQVFAKALHAIFLLHYESDFVKNRA